MRSDRYQSFFEGKQGIFATGARYWLAGIRSARAHCAGVRKAGGWRRPRFGAREIEYIERRRWHFVHELATIADGIETTHVCWGEVVEGSAREILGEIEVDDAEGSTEREDAEQFLCDLLRGGAVPSKQIRADAAGAGYSWATIRRAKKSLGVKAVKEGGAFGDGRQQWAWRLNDWKNTEGAHEAQKVLTQIDEHLQENLSTFSKAEEDFEV